MTFQIFELPTRQCNHLMNMLLSISRPNLKEIRWKMTEKSEDKGGWKEEKYVPWVHELIKNIGKLQTKSCLSLSREP